jgi:hypothetical protein
MSSTAIVRYILANDTGLTAVVPATAIAAGVVPINTVLPAISITEISSLPRGNVNAPDGFYRDRVQVTVEATTYPQAKQIIALIRAVFTTYKRGTVNGFNCDSVIPDTAGPDLFDQQTNIHSQSLDFIVRWHS